MGTNASGVFVGGAGDDLEDEWILEHLVGAQRVGDGWMLAGSRPTKVWIARAKKGVFIGAGALGEPLLAEEPASTRLAPLLAAFPQKELLVFLRVDFSDACGYALFRDGVRIERALSSEPTARQPGSEPEPILRRIAGVVPWDRVDGDDQSLRRTEYTLHPTESEARLNAPPPPRARIEVPDAAAWSLCFGPQGEVNLARVASGRLEWHRYEGAGSPRLAFATSTDCEGAVELLGIGQDSATALVAALRLGGGGVEVARLGADGRAERLPVEGLASGNAELRAVHANNRFHFLLTRETPSGRLELRRAAEGFATWEVDASVVTGIPEVGPDIGLVMSRRSDLFTLEMGPSFDWRTGRRPMIVGRCAASSGWENPSIIVARFPAPAEAQRRCAMTFSGRVVLLEAPTEDAVELVTTPELEA